jgi:hypothetical protein
MLTPQMLTPELSRTPAIARARLRTPGLLLCLVAAVACNGKFETNRDVEGLRTPSNAGNNGSGASAGPGTQPGGIVPGATGSETGTDNIRGIDDDSTSSGARRGISNRTPDRDDDDADAGVEEPEADAGVVEVDAGVVVDGGVVEVDAGLAADAGAAAP